MHTPTRNTLFTDGEGPLVYKDLAFDLAGRMRIRDGNESSGRKFFEVLSLYDDFLTEHGRPGYQAGDTLALIVPHLLCHHICDHDIEEEAHEARMVAGVPEYIFRMQHDAWDIRVISTAYRPMWNFVGASLRIPKEEIACTDMSLDLIRTQVDLSRMRVLVTEAEARVADSRVGFFDDLDELYWKNLPAIGYEPLEVVSVMGGRRKVDAAHRFTKDLGVSLSDVVYIGDSITDDALLSEVKNAGGLAIAVNGNEYALRNAMVAVATTDMRHFLPLLDAWQQSGYDGVQTFVQSSGHSKDGVHYALVNRENEPSFRKLLKIHKEYRSRVRGAAALLG